MSSKKARKAALGASWRSAQTPTGESFSSKGAKPTKQECNWFGEFIRIHQFLISCNFQFRVTRFLEKPQVGLTESRLASVVFYCIQKDSLSCLSDFLNLQPQAAGKSFGRFWVWKKKSIFCAYLIISFVMCVEVSDILTLVIIVRFSLINNNKSPLLMKPRVPSIFRSLFLSLCKLSKTWLSKLRNKQKFHKPEYFFPLV